MTSRHICIYRPFTDSATDLSAAVDVYADWIDACDAVAKEQGPTERSSHRMGGPPKAAAAGGDDDLDGFVENDELDAEGEFADDD